MWADSACWHICVIARECRVLSATSRFSKPSSSSPPPPPKPPPPHLHTQHSPQPGLNTTDTQHRIWEKTAAVIMTSRRCDTQTSHTVKRSQTDTASSFYCTWPTSCMWQCLWVHLQDFQCLLVRHVDYPTKTYRLSNPSFPNSTQVVVFWG